MAAQAPQLLVYSKFLPNLISNEAKGAKPKVFETIWNALLISLLYSKFLLNLISNEAKPKVFETIGIDLE